jgi:BASS family bile acid:Na+ symporter
VAETFHIVIKVIAFATMTLVGTDCTLEELRDSLRRPRLMIMVGLGQFLVVPITMYGCSYLLGVFLVMTASLILVACCPAGAISNTYCYLMKCNTSLSVSLTTLSNLAAMVATPVTLSMAREMMRAQNSGLPLIPVMPILRELGVMMVVPLVIGAIIRTKVPARVLAHRRLLRRMALALVIALLVLIIGTGPKEVVRHLREIASVTVLFTAVLLALGWWMSLVFRLSANDRLGILFEFPCRN